MVLPIVHYNSPVLREKGEPVVAFDPALAQLARDMIETMHAARGIGLAAQQVGRAIQFCVVDLRAAEIDFDWQLDGAHTPMELFMPMAIANPRIIVPVGVEKDVYEEGCLSFPGITGDVNRPDEVEVRYHDLQGVEHMLICNGLLARCIQHEADHLNGTLFIDRMDKRTRRTIDRAIKDLAEKTAAESAPSA